LKKLKKFWIATSYQKIVIFVLCLLRFKVLTKLIMKSALLECDTMQLVKRTNISEDPAASTVRAHLSAFMVDVAGSSEISAHLYQAMCLAIPENDSHFSFLITCY